MDYCPAVSGQQRGCWAQRNIASAPCVIYPTHWPKISQVPLKCIHITQKPMASFLTDVSRKSLPPRVSFRQICGCNYQNEYCSIDACVLCGKVRRETLAILAILRTSWMMPSLVPALLLINRTSIRFVNTFRQ